MAELTVLGGGYTVPRQENPFRTGENQWSRGLLAELRFTVFCFLGVVAFLPHFLRFLHFLHF